MSEHAKNNPAFPAKLPNQNTVGTEARDFAFFSGMTLRDYFAAAATESDIREHRRTDGRGTYIGSREEARFAYADAMLAARGDA